jgi:hypothetical protein
MVMRQKEFAATLFGVPLVAARRSVMVAAAYQILLVALIFVRPNLVPSWHTVTEWIVGRNGWIVVLALLISATSYASLFVVVRSQVTRMSGKVGFGILAICAVGAIGVGG